MPHMLQLITDRHQTPKAAKQNEAAARELECRFDPQMQTIKLYNSHNL